MKGVKALRLFYNGRCVKAISEGKTMESKSKGILIAKYKFDCSKADLFPEFNEGFEYTFVDEQVDEADVLTVDRETVTVMTYDAEPDEYGVLTTEYEVETPVLINAGDIVTRSIYSNELPTLMRFGTTITDSTIPATNAESLLEVLSMNTTALETMSMMFYRCSNITSIRSKWNTDKVTNMRNMFAYCSSLTSLDVSDFNTSNVKDMRSMFHGCKSLTSLEVSSWDTHNVTDMGSMFNSCISLIKLDMKNWKINKDSQLSSMFSTCSSLTELNLNSWENLPFMIYGMFYGCKSLTTLNLSNICINEEPYMSSYYFYDCKNLTSIIMHNSDYNSINKIIAQLPTRTSGSMGTLNIAGVDDINQVNITTAQSKYWNIVV